MSVEYKIGDCLELMAQMDDNSVNLVVMDPPYNIGKDHWDKVDNYVGWMGKVFTECERILKDNGSLYFFHNDFLQMVDLQQWLNNHSGLIFKQLITWNKKFAGAPNEVFLQGYNELTANRNYQKFVEYCLYYTFQDESGLTKVKHDCNNFKSLRTYFKEFQEALGMNKTEMLSIIGQRVDHCFRWGSSQWDLPTEETYTELCKLPLKCEFVRQEYEELRQEYEELRQEYEELRYTFNNQKTSHAVWNYPIADKVGHVTPKPVELIENIIKHSSNEGDLVLDPFLGSGTTLIACKNLNRNFIGFEKDPNYEAIIKKRISEQVPSLDKWN